jgi:hypothetical protein
MSIEYNILTNWTLTNGYTDTVINIYFKSIPFRQAIKINEYAPLLKPPITD